MKDVTLKFVKFNDNNEYRVMVFSGDEGAERAEPERQKNAPQLIQRESDGRKQPYDREYIQRRQKTSASSAIAQFRIPP